jgi:hypothetical protein
MQAYWVCQTPPLRLLHTQKYTRRTSVSCRRHSFFFGYFFLAANATLMKFAPRSVKLLKGGACMYTRAQGVHADTRAPQGMHAHTSSLLKEALPLTLCMHTRKVSKVSRQPLRPHQTPQKCRNESIYTYVCIYI